MFAAKSRAVWEMKFQSQFISFLLVISQCPPKKAHWGLMASSMSIFSPGKSANDHLFAGERQTLPLRTAAGGSPNRPDGDLGFPKSFMGTSWWSCWDSRGPQFVNSNRLNCWIFWVYHLFEIFGVFLNWGYPKMVGLQGQLLLKWMMKMGYPDFRKPRDLKIFEP